MKQLRQHLEWHPSAEKHARVGIHLMCDGVQLALGVARQIPASGLAGDKARLNGKELPDVTLWVLNEEGREVRPAEVGEIGWRGVTKRN